MVRPTSLSSKTRRVAALATAGLAAAALGVASAPAASAEPSIRVDYPVSGTTAIKATGSSMALGPGTLETTLDFGNGDLTANLKMPAAKGEFKQWGVIPVSVTTEFIEATPTTGKVDLNTGATQSTSKVTLKLSNLKVAGIPTPVGDNCKTKTPATITLNSGSDWDVLNGGTMAGTYTIPEFQNCLLATPLINLTVPGPDNTISLKLGAATVPPTVAEMLRQIGD
ncbi:hypothetical protein GCM10023085_81760 [Actinomadura viridis]|uniref:Uncharacterized protein n=1 Tax=Actinomadura viridis TaxID=58110 RepID=A0A931GKX7_9ACTN|nr:hypothetical protein [Actinomadura viridis]MBG6091383.1 hypothetical protein [Actinomadura viridis]